MNSISKFLRTISIFAVLLLTIFITVSCEDKIDDPPPQTVEKPTAIPAGGNYTSAQTVTLTSATTEADIHYTLDGTAPTASSAKYSSSITISATSTLKAIAVKTGMTNSDILTETYTITLPEKVIQPTATPAGGNYTSAQTVTLTSATTGADIHYTLDGTTPTASSAKYSSPITISTTTTLKAIAVKSDMTNSDILTETYTITLAQVIQPTATPAGGNYASAQTVTLTTTTTGAAIFYTLDGTSPSTGSSYYTSAITISETTTLKAIAVETDMTSSGILTEHYTITPPGKVVQPLATPEGDNYTTAQTVTLASATTGATIHYSLDGSDPTTSSPLYSIAITITETTTLKAIAVKTDMTNSDILTETYTITLPTPTNYTITFDANGGSGTAPAAQTVNAGSSITLPDGSGLTMSGYTFGGWNTNASGTGTNYSAGSSYTPTDSITLYARWHSSASTTYIVMFFTNGGSGTAPTTQTVNAGSSITLPDGSGLTRSGYTFGGWNTNSSGTGTNYAVGSSYTVTGTTLLYAKWDSSASTTYTVWFLINGGSGTAPATQTVNAGSSITLPSGSGLTRTGYTFGGWNTSSSGTGTNYAAGSSYTVTGTVILYAKWVEGSGTHEVTIAMWDGYGDGWNGSAALRINVNGTNFSTNARLTSGGGPGYYTFFVNAGDVVQIYWVSGSSMFNFDYECAFAVYYSDDPPNPAFSPTTDAAVDSGRLLVYRQYRPSGSAAFGDGTLMGSFTVGGYTVTFDANGGSGTAPTMQTVTAGSSITLPSGSGLIRTGYTFGGWNTNAFGTGTNYNAGSTFIPSGTTTLYAKWDSTSLPTKEITSFRFADFSVNGTINGPNITVTVPNIVNLTTLVPTIVHNGRSVSPASGVAQNFSSPIQYTVTAEDNSTQNYTVTVTVTNTGLAAAFAWVNSYSGSTRDFTIVAQANESIAPITIDPNSSTNIILSGGTTEKTISLNTNGSLFTIYYGTLTLDNNITLQGRSSNYASLVRLIMSSANLVMNTGSKIIDNTAVTNSTSSFRVVAGGGVYVGRGTFTMNGGTISGYRIEATNSSSSSYSSDIRAMGGGVLVEDGTFIMNNGTISNNTAYSNKFYSGGGGVFVGEYGTFTMINGTISGNTAQSSSVLAISYAYGGGVAVWDYGTFTMQGGTISGNTVTSADNRLGGGVYVQNDRFTKTGGTIYGSNASPTSLQNTAKDTNSGHAVYALVSSSIMRRNSTAGTAVNLDSSRVGSAGGWE
jgi:uncharacterized repeat protein (TIGR02543 family)